jgi:PleD family two-component response regulator
MNRGKILVVDDDPLALRLTQARLSTAKFDVVCRNEALGTMQAIIEQQPDIVVVDLDMPALSGANLAKLMRQNKQTSHIPFIIHSSQSLARLQTLAHELGAVGAIPKTPDDAIFSQQLERLLSRIRPAERTK